MKENNRMTICRKIKLFPVGDKEEINSSLMIDILEICEITQ